MGFGCLFLGGAFLSGVYPAFVLSGYHPIAVLKGIFKIMPEESKKIFSRCSEKMLYNVPKFYFKVNYLKDLLHYFILKLLVLIKPESKGHTQAYFAMKK